MHTFMRCVCLDWCFHGNLLLDGQKRYQRGRETFKVRCQSEIRREFPVSASLRLCAPLTFRIPTDREENAHASKLLCCAQYILGIFSVYTRKKNKSEIKRLFKLGRTLQLIAVEQKKNLINCLKQRFKQVQLED